MNAFQLFGAIGLPIAMVIGAIATWRATRKESTPVEKPVWRDDSLDDWRRERSRQAEEERASRGQQPQADVKTGRAEEESVQKKHQRIGG